MSWFNHSYDYKYIDEIAFDMVDMVANIGG